MPVMPLEVEQPIVKPKKKRRTKLKLFLLSLIIIASTLGIAHYLEYVDLQEYSEKLFDIFN
jgi:disulfide bond formation protein DsbB